MDKNVCLKFNIARLMEYQVFLVHSIPVQLVLISTMSAKIKNTASESFSIVRTLILQMRLVFFVNLDISQLMITSFACLKFKAVLITTNLIILTPIIGVVIA